MAEASKPTYEDYVRNSPEYSRPSDVAEGDYHIEFTVQKDPNIEDQQFIYESCLLIAASSAQTSFDDAAVDKGYTGGEDNTVDMRPASRMLWILHFSLRALIGSDSDRKLSGSHP